MIKTPSQLLILLCILFMAAPASIQAEESREALIKQADVHFFDGKALYEKTVSILK